MITVQILEQHDIIQATDWCRPLTLQTMSGGLSDDYSFESCYSGAPENNTKWVQASEIVPAWVGSTVGEWVAALEDCRAYVPYEFIRGDIPKEHQYGKTKRQLREEYTQYLANTTAHVGKYKGKTWKHIKDYDYRYFDWAESQQIVKRLEDFDDYSRYK